MGKTTERMTLLEEFDAAQGELAEEFYSLKDKLEAIMREPFTDSFDSREGWALYRGQLPLFVHADTALQDRVAGPMPIKELVAVLPALTHTLYHQRDAKKLFRAVENGDIAMVKECLSEGYDINECPERGWRAEGLYVSPIANACANGNLGLVRFLISKGATTDGSNNAAGRTLLHYATGYGEPEIIKMLVREYGFDVNVRDKSGRTPLFYAAWTATPVRSVISLLVTLGADIHVKANRGDHLMQTPLLTALHAGNLHGVVEMAGLHQKRVLNTFDELQGMTVESYIKRYFDTVHEQRDSLLDELRTHIAEARRKQIDDAFGRFSSAGVETSTGSERSGLVL